MSKAHPVMYRTAWPLTKHQDQFFNCHFHYLTTYKLLSLIVHKWTEQERYKERTWKNIEFRLIKVFPIQVQENQPVPCAFQKAPSVLQHTDHVLPWPGNELASIETSDIFTCIWICFKYKYQQSHAIPMQKIRVSMAKENNDGWILGWEITLGHYMIYIMDVW